MLPPMKKYILLFVLSLIFNSGFSQNITDIKTPSNQFSTTKPGVLWWWFADRIKTEDVHYQIDWLKENNIGNVLIFFLYPLNRMQKDTVHYANRYELFGKEFSEIALDTKKYCEQQGISCNFLFGTGWPFGGTFVNRKDASLSWTNEGLTPMRTFSVSWEWPKKGYVIDHLNKAALDRYFDYVSVSFQPSIFGNKTYFECDSWEIAEFEPIWTNGFDSLFQQKFGYDITPYVSKFSKTDSSDSLLFKLNPFTARLYGRNNQNLEDIRYDYYTLVSDLALNNFYRHFTKRCNEIGAGSVVECCGTPADLIDAFASVDLPMTEAMLYEPNYSKIPASAVTLSGKNILTSETFTCAYGFKAKQAYNEQIADMKLIADAMFVNGVNHVYWHGFALNPKGFDTVSYYATVNVSPKSKLMNGFPEFNEYMDRVCNYMQKGKNLTEIAVYLPTEDRWSEGIYDQEFFNQLNPEERFWHFSKYQMRYEYFPEELNGFPMLWINNSFLKEAKLEGKVLKVGDAEFKTLYINVNHLTYEALCKILEIAEKGFPVCLKHDITEPGTIKNKDYGQKLDKLKSLKNVSTEFFTVYKNPALISGKELPEYWIRKDGENTCIFFSNPKTKVLKYPVQYGQSIQNVTITKDITLNIHNENIPLKLVFEPYQSILIKIDLRGNVNFENIEFIPETPQSSIK